MSEDLRDRFRTLDRLAFPHEAGPPTRTHPSRERPPDPRSSLRRAGTAAFALILAVGAIGYAVRAFQRTPEGPAATVDAGTIAYVALDGDRWQLHSVRPDGSDDHRISVELPGNAFHPTWSPDGTRLAFDAGSGADRDIYVVNADGSDLTKLSSVEGSDSLPAWSPDGSRIAYVHTTGSNDDVWVMNVDGSRPVRLTDDEGLDLEPVWSPDSRTIAFQSNRTGNPEIYTMLSDGSNVSQVTDNRSFDGSPAWSPDGQRLAFASDRDGAGIYLTNIDGSDIRKLTEATQVGPIAPVWSPDGGRIAYTTVRDGLDVIVALDLTTLDEDVIVRGDGVCCPSWGRTAPTRTSFPSVGTLFVVTSESPGQIVAVDPSTGLQGAVVFTGGRLDDVEVSPGGRQVAFVGTGGIWIANADGTAPRQITSDPSDGSPSWSPDGSKIVFSRERDGTVFLMIDELDGSAARPIPTGTVDTYNPAWSPDGSAIAFAGSPRQEAPRTSLGLYVVSAGGGEPRSLGGSDVALPSWSPNADKLSYLSRGRIFVVDREGRTARAIFTEPGGAMTGLAWSPDGSELAIIGGADVRRPGIGIVDVESGGVRWLESGLRDPLDVSWAVAA